MKTIVHRFAKNFGCMAESIIVGVFVLLILAPLHSFAQSRNDAARSVNALLNYASRSDREDRNRTLERFTLPDHASPMAQSVLSAIAQTAGSSDTINRGQRAAAIHEAMSEVITPSEIAGNVIHEDKGFKDNNERAEKITKEMAKAIEEKLSSHSDFKLAAIEDRKEFRDKEREREQKFEEKFGDREHKDRANLVSQITNFNDGKESKSKELERLAFNKTDNGRSGKGGKDNDNKSVSIASKAEDKAAKSEDKKADDKKPDDNKSDDKKENKGKK